MHSLQGALGKTSGRSYKAAPRQLLQVDPANAAATLSGTHPHISREDGQGHSLGRDSDGAVREAAKLGREALGDAAGVSCLLIVVFPHNLPTYSRTVW